MKKRHIVVYPLAILLAIIVALASLYHFSAPSKKFMQLKMLDGLSTMAVKRSTMRAENGETSVAAEFIDLPIEVTRLRDYIYHVTGVANIIMIATTEGHILFDTGLVVQVPKQIAALKKVVPDAPLTHIIVSHSHADHIGGVRYWQEEGTQIIAHEAFTEEQRYLTELQTYMHNRNRLLFPFMPETPPTAELIRYGGVVPDIIVEENVPLTFTQGGVRFEIMALSGAEGADNIVLWLPDEKILLSGDFFGPIFPQFPNVFTMRGEKIRRPIEYIAGLNEIIALEPEMIVPGHLQPIEGRDKIQAGLIKMRDATQYVHDATVAGMNEGRTVYELMESITLPPALELTQAHGRVSWAVKSIWEYYTTWFHFDRTSELYGVNPRDVYPDITALAGLDQLTDRAHAYVAEGRPIHALHLLEIALDGNPQTARHKRANQVKREALALLLKEAQDGLNNSYEIYWLTSQLRGVDAILAQP